MAVEQGFVDYINTGIATALPNVKGGFAVMLPQNFISKANPWSWMYRSIISTPLYSLSGENALTSWEVQIDCVGYSMLHAITMSNAIVSALSGGFTGAFTDGTVVAGIFKSGTQIDGFQPDALTFIRSLEYRIHYYAT